MTDIERCINYLRFGESGNYIETEDGSIRVTRIDKAINTLPDCYITENGRTRVSTYFYADTVEVLKRMIVLDK